MIRTSDAVIPVSEFKSRTSKYLNMLHTGRGPLVITQNGHAACVVVDPKEYDELYRLHVLRAIEDGLKDVEAGRTMSTEEVRKALGLTNE